MTVTLILVDDHVLFRQGLKSLLAEQSEWQIVGEAGDGEEAVQLAERLKPDIAVVDIEMPGMDGIEAAREINRVSPNSRIIALSMYGDGYYQRRMFEVGASAFVLKNEAVGDLVDAVHASLSGERFVSPSAVIPDDARSAKVEKGLLSKRELDVMRLLVEGLRTKEIAASLGISAKTVETYRSRIMLKLGIDNLPGLVKFAIRAGIASPDG